VLQVGFNSLVQGHGGWYLLEVTVEKPGLQLKGLLPGDLQVPRFQAPALVLALVPEVRAVGLLFAAGIDADAIPDQDGLVVFSHVSSQDR
jgi:hypothetical protein